MEDSENYYIALGVSKDADQETIKFAFRKLAREYHPDKVAGLGVEFQELASRKMEQINEAYRVLSDAEERAEYDKMLQSGQVRRGAPKRRPPAARPKKDVPEQKQMGDVKRDHAREQMMMESSLFQIRDAIKKESGLGWAEEQAAGFACAISARSMTKRYYVYFKSIYTLSPYDFTGLMQTIRSMDMKSKGGLSGKATLVVIIFASMEDGVKVEGLWKAFNDESLASKKSKKYIALINSTTGKAFPPSVNVKDKRMRKVIDNIKLIR